MNLKQKSEDNLKAALILHDSRLCNSSVHCSYYSCLQMMKHYLCNVSNISYDEQADCCGLDMGTHKFIYNYFLKILFKKKIVHTDFVTFNTNFTTLKLKREKADYTNKMIGSRESEKSYNALLEIIEIFKTYI